MLNINVDSIIFTGIHCFIKKNLSILNVVIYFSKFLYTEKWETTILWFFL